MQHVDPSELKTEAFQQGFEWQSTPEDVRKARVEANRHSLGASFDALEPTTACHWGWFTEEAEQWRAGVAAAKAVAE